MKKIGNIYTDKPFLDVNLYNVTDKLDEIDTNIPTLVVGYDLSKRFSENFNILNEKIDENTFWTFGKMEKRHVFESSLDNFQKFCLDRLKTKTKYSFFNVLTKPKEEKVKLFDKVKESKECVYCVLNDMVYINIDKSDLVVGLSLRDIDYCGNCKANLLTSLKSMRNTKCMTNMYSFPHPIKQFLLNNPYMSVKLYN